MWEDVMVVFLSESKVKGEKQRSYQDLFNLQRIWDTFHTKVPIEKLYSEHMQSFNWVLTPLLQLVSESVLCQICDITHSFNPYSALLLYLYVS